MEKVNIIITDCQSGLYWYHNFLNMDFTATKQDGRYLVELKDNPHLKGRNLVYGFESGYVELNDARVI